MSGYIIMYRNRETHEIFLEAVEDWSEILDDNDLIRLFYCQAVSDWKAVRNEIAQEIHPNLGLDANDIMQDLLDSAQMIASSYPLQSFRPSPLK